MAEEIQTQATEEAGIGEVTSEEELLQYLGATAEEEEKKDDDEEDKGLPNPNAKESEEKEEKEEKKEGSEETEEEFNNMVEYINKRYDLNLNIDELPKDMDRQQEAEIIANLYDKVVDSANQKIGNYQGIEEVLKDKEVAQFIDAKRNGKTLRDFVSEYSTTIEGKSDESVVKDSLKQQFPDMSDEDIDDMIQDLKTKDKLSTMATNVRNREAEAEEKSRQQKEEEEKKAREDEEKARAEDIANYKGYVGKISNVNGIPLDSAMKNELIVAATQPDKDGLTYLERALQSDLGVVRATLGLLHLEKLMNASKSTNKNRIRNDIMERLTADPKDLQSGTRVESSDEFNEEAANSF